MNKKKIFFILLFVIEIFQYGQSKLYTAYSCEGHTLKLSCYIGYEIKVIKGDYGRWNAKVCQYFEDSEMNLNCHSKYAEEIIKTECNGHRTCKIKANNENMADDPCPGQVKYAEAKYMCVKKPTTVNVSHQSETSQKHVPNDELINKGFNALLNMANNHNKKIEYGNNENMTNPKYIEVQPAYNPHFKTQNEEYSMSTPHNKTIGWNIFK